MDKSKPFLVLRYDEKTGTHIIFMAIVYPAEKGSSLHKEVRYSFGKDHTITETKGLYLPPDSNFGYGVDKGEVFSRQTVTWNHLVQVTAPFMTKKGAYQHLPIFAVKPLPTPRMLSFHSWEQVENMDRVGWAALETQYATIKGLSIAINNILIGRTSTNDINGVSVVFDRSYTKTEQAIVHKFFKDEFNKQGMANITYFENNPHKLTVLCVLANDSKNLQKAAIIANRFEGTIRAIAKKFHDEIPAAQVDAIAKTLGIDLHSTSPANTAKKRGIGIY